MNLRQKKEIITSILKKEIIENNLNINFYSLCRINYYNSDSFRSIQNKKTSKLNKKINLVFPLKANGCFRKEQSEIIIFLDEKYIIPGISRSIVKLLKTTYHELFHAIQDKEITNLTGQISYNLFASICDEVILNHPNFNNTNNYNRPVYHSSLMFEILANLYGINKTKEYINNNNIICNPNEITQLEEEKKFYQYQYQNYDLTERLNLIISEYKKGISIGILKKTVFELFLNDDAAVKDINMIFSNENVLKLNPKILLAFIKTNAIKKAISESSLTEKTSYILNELLTNGSTQLLQESENKKTI